MDKILQSISSCIQQNALCNGGHRLLVAISGGPDSVFLAFALKSLGYEIGLAHVNYQLRGDESEREEALLHSYATQWQLPLYVEKVDTKVRIAQGKDSLQVVARRIRYAFFEKIMAEEGYDRCALAHQADDQSEQALLSLLTGNGPDVLQKIPVKRGPYIRPLIEISRSEILLALKKAKLTYAIDSSNLKNDYLRNQVRNQLRPVLQELNPRADEQLRRKQNLYEKQKSFLDRLFQQWMRSCMLSEEADALQQIDWRPFADSWGEAHLPVFMAYVLGEWGLHGHVLWQGVDLIDAQVGKAIWMDEKCLRRSRHGMTWGTEVPSPSHEIQITRAEMRDLPQEWNWGDKKLRFSYLASNPPQWGNKRHFYLDFDEIRFPMRLRPWREGDFMQPFGMQGHKKLSDIFVDEKYTTVQKREAFVLADSEKVLLLSDFRISDSVRMTDRTKRTLLVEVL